MQMTVNAVEAFRRARMVDGVTSDDDKVAPVYKMEEIIEILQQAPADVVHEMTDYLLKSRMEHRSPNVRLKVSDWSHPRLDVQVVPCDVIVDLHYLAGE